VAVEATNFLKSYAFEVTSVHISSLDEGYSFFICFQWLSVDLKFFKTLPTV